MLSGFGCWALLPDFPRASTAANWVVVGGGGGGGGGGGVDEFDFAGG